MLKYSAESSEICGSYNQMDPNINFGILRCEAKNIGACGSKSRKNIQKMQLENGKNFCRNPSILKVKKN